jgi:general secretion pathway protein G
MAKRERKVFFAWEKRTGVLGFAGRARVRQILAGAAVFSFTAWVFARESDAAKTRATRAAIGATYRAVSAYRADHAGACPKDLSELKTGGYLKVLQSDAWDHKLRLVCPGKRDPNGFDLVSDGANADDGFSRVE